MTHTTTDAVVAPPTRSTTPRRRLHGRRPAPRWVRTLVGGLALWLAAVLITFATGNSNLIPTVILLGSFLVPATFVMYALRHADEVVTAERVVSAFIFGGVLGVLGASVVEAAFLRSPSGAAYLGVGLIEEAAKLAALWLLARHLPRYTARDGVVLGAAVGFGFAAFESAGYAFNALFTNQGVSLMNLVETEVLRGILTPVGHGIWTAILGGALFRVAAHRGRLRLSASVLGAYLLVAVLHGLWDASEGIAAWLTLVMIGGQAQWVTTPSGPELALTPAQVHLVTALNWGLMAVVAVLGLVILRYGWRRATALDRAELGSAATAGRPDSPQPARVESGRR
jgi:RsiW-degrading membrane proteinase PrsW (M82 family)